MAILPSIVRSNPNASSLIAGGIAGGVAYGIFEQDPLTSVAIGAAGAVVSRGLIHLDTTTHTVEIGKSKVVVAEIGNDKFAFSGVLDLKELDGLDLNTVQQQFAGKVAKKAKAS
jgi:hypothetical protein